MVIEYQKLNVLLFCKLTIMIVDIISYGLELDCQIKFLPIENLWIR